MGNDLFTVCYSCSNELSSQGPDTAASDPDISPVTDTVNSEAIAFPSSGSSTSLGASSPHSCCPSPICSLPASPSLNIAAVSSEEQLLQRLNLKAELARVLSFRPYRTLFNPVIPQYHAS